MAVTTDVTYNPMLDKLHSKRLSEVRRATAEEAAYAANAIDALTVAAAVVPKLNSEGFGIVTSGPPYPPVTVDDIRTAEDRRKLDEDRRKLDEDRRKLEEKRIANEASGGQLGPKLNFDGSAVQDVNNKLPADPEARKKLPMATGVLDYFPLALAYVASVSKAGNDQHNPGQPMHWARDKSTDHANTIVRHLAERGTKDVDGRRHTGKLAWRALALLQTELEAAIANGEDPFE